MIAVHPRQVPPLDPGFVPAVLWNRAYERLVADDPGRRPLRLVVQRANGACFHQATEILPQAGAGAALNLRHVERLLKFLLWQKGGSRVFVAGCDLLAAELARIYAPGGERAFDAELAGRMFLEPLTVHACTEAELPAPAEPAVPLGRRLDGCRIGFDLGGSDRKCAAVIDGRVVFTAEVPWNPYFEPDPAYHLAGIRDSLRQAAAHLPRVDAIGGSAAGVYVDNEVRVASLFRGVPPAVFETRVRHLFAELRREWGGIPFEVANDGEVTALAGSMSLGRNALLGISLGTSMAAGWCDRAGRITVWLNELAFAPVDFREDAPVDEWSGDRGCGVQYFSQQAVDRLLPAAGIAVPADMPLPEKLIAVQNLMASDDPRARRVYETLGVYLGYAIAHYADFYDLENLLILGRVTTGAGGAVILDRARAVLRDEFPALSARLGLFTPDEQDKRLGQAVAAASLPALPPR